MLTFRDLKPENLLLARNNDLRLIDFGSAIDTNLEVANYYVGTLEYMAPEVASKMQPGDVFHKVRRLLGQGALGNIGVGCISDDARVSTPCGDGVTV